MVLMSELPGGSFSIDKENVMDKKEEICQIGQFRFVLRVPQSHQWENISEETP